MIIRIEGMERMERILRMERMFRERVIISMIGIVLLLSGKNLFYFGNNIAFSYFR